MKPEILTTLEDGMDYAGLKGVIDEVSIQFKGKTYFMGFISIQRLQQDFLSLKQTGMKMSLRDYGRHFVVSEVTAEEIESTVLACDREGSLDYYLNKQ